MNARDSSLSIRVKVATDMDWDTATESGVASPFFKDRATALAATAASWHWRIRGSMRSPNSVR